MKELHMTARLLVKQGKLDAFQNVAQQCIERTREKDTGTIQYNWYHNDDKSEFAVRENYRDSQAAMEHMQNLSDLVEPLLATCTISVEICGEPAEELRIALEGLDVKYYSFYAGL